MEIRQTPLFIPSGVRKIATIGINGSGGSEVGSDAVRRARP